MSHKPNEPDADNTVNDREGLADKESSGDGGSSTHSEDPGPSDGVVASLIDELQQGNVSEEQLELLRSELAFEHPNSMEVRLRYIQSRMEEFAAYIEGLEDLIDAHGSAKDIIDDLNSQIEALRGDLGQLRAEFEALAEDHDAVDSELTTLTETVAELEQRVATGFQNTRDQLTTLQETHAADVSQLRAALEEVKDEVTAVKEEVTAAERELRSGIDTLHGEVKTNTEHRKRLMDVANQMRQLNSSRPDSEPSSDDPA